MGVSLSELRELVMDREAWRAAVHGIAKSDMTEQLNWTELNWSVFILSGITKKKIKQDYTLPFLYQISNQLPSPPRFTSLEQVLIYFGFISTNINANI